MKFICQSCSREFDFGAPRGMQLPCPACGGSLIDEETMSGAPVENDAAEALNAPTVLGMAPIPDLPPPPPQMEATPAAEGYAPETEAGYESVPLDGYSEAGVEYETEYVDEAGESGVYVVAGGTKLLYTGWILFAMAFAGLAVSVLLIMNSRKQIEAAITTQRRLDDATRSTIQLERENSDFKKALDENKDALNKFIAENTKIKKQLAELGGATTTEGARSTKLEQELKSSRGIVTKLENEVKAKRSELETNNKMLAKYNSTLNAALRAMRAIDSLDRPSRLGVALGYLNASIEASDTFAEAYWMRAQIYTNLHRGEDALADYLRAHELTRAKTGIGHIRALIAAGDVCRLLLNNTKQAIEYYDKAAELAPDTPAAYLAEVRSKVLSRRTTNALELTNEYIALNERNGNDTVDLRLVKVEILAMNDAARRNAIQEAELVLAEAPNNVEALDIRGRLLLKENMLTYAIDDLQRAMKLDPLGTERLAPLGKALVEDERYANAVAILQRALESEKDNLDIKVMLGRAFVELQKYDEARRVLTEVIGADSKSVAAFRLRGRAQMGNKNFNAAIGDFERAVRIKSDDVGSRKNLAKVYVTATDRQHRDPTKAIMHLAVVLEIVKTDAEVYALKAMAHAARNEKDKAALSMRSAVSLDPTKEIYRQLLNDYQQQ